MITLSGVGAPTTNGWHEDLITRVQRVESGTNLWMAANAWVSTNADCPIGTDNARAFQAAVDASLGQTNVAVYVPPGKYLFIPTGVRGRSNALTCAVTITNSVRLLGSDPERTILLGNGAWQRCGAKAPTCQRGLIFEIRGPMPSTNAGCVSGCSQTKASLASHLTPGPHPQETDGGGMRPTDRISTAASPRSLLFRHSPTAVSSTGAAKSSRAWRR